MQKTVRKEEVEELLGCEITNEQFQEALKYAVHKQEYTYELEGDKRILQHWYLVKLTEEYVRSLAFSRYTFDLCRLMRLMRNMEKEHSVKNQSALTDNHIVAETVL